MKNTRRKLIALILFIALVVGGAYTAYGQNSAYSERVASPNTVSTTEPQKPGDKPIALPLPVPLQPSTPVAAAIKETTMTLKVFDKPVDLAGMPLILSTEGKVMLPLRKLGETMGYSVKWDDSIKAAILQKGTESITVKINSVEYTWGSVPRRLSSKAETYRNRLYVPTDFITSNPALSLTQTPTAIVIGLAEKETKNAVTGAIEEITLYSNGLGLKVSEKNTSLMLYVSDETVITNYSTGAVLDKAVLKIGAKAIFSYTTVQGDGQKSYFLLKTIEVVDEAESKILP